MASLKMFVGQVTSFLRVWQKHEAPHYLSQDDELPMGEKLILKFHLWLKEISLSEERGFGLDPSNVTVEKFPLIVAPVNNLRLKRIDDK